MSPKIALPVYYINCSTYRIDRIHSQISPIVLVLVCCHCRHQSVFQAVCCCNCVWWSETWERREERRVGHCLPVTSVQLWTKCSMRRTRLTNSEDATFSSRPACTPTKQKEVYALLLLKHVLFLICIYASLWWLMVYSQEHFKRRLLTSQAHMYICTHT